MNIFNVEITTGHILNQQFFDKFNEILKVNSFRSQISLFSIIMHNNYCIIFFLRKEFITY